MSLMDLTAVQLGKMIREKELTAVEATEDALSQISLYDSTYHSFISVDEDGAIKRAKKVQEKIDSGILTGPLAGVPVGIKDNLFVKGMKNTCGSKMLKDFYPAYSATTVLNLEAAGAVIIGKTNMDECSIGSTTESSAFFTTKNPLDIECVPGGSSGGSAAAVAGKECSYALGSDTGGSIRQPAAFCGLTGLKPSYGRVSRYGLVAYASSFDQIGPISRDVTDCATIMEILASYDENDSMSIKREDNNFTKALINDVRGMKIGLAKGFFGTGVEPDVKAAVFSAIEILRNKGAIIEEFDLSNLEYGVHIYHIIAAAEASSNLARFDGVNYGYRSKEFDGYNDMYYKSRSQGFGMDVKKKIVLGSFVLSAENYEKYYKKALKARKLLNESFSKAFKKYDVILGPTTATTAPKLGDKSSNIMGDYYTIPANLLGLPAITVPCGLDSMNLPIGLQLIGNHFQESTIIRVAYTYEQARGEIL